MAELHDELAIVLVNAFPHFAPERDFVVGIHHGVVWQDPSASMYRYKGRNDGPHAAFGKSCLPINAGLASGAVVVVKSAGYVRPDEPVLDGQITKGQSFEYTIRHSDGSLLLESPNVLNQSALFGVA